MTGGPPEPGSALPGTALLPRAVPFRAVFASLLALALVATAPGWVAGVRAEPTRVDLEAAEERLFELESEFSMAVEDYHQAREQHAAVVAEIGARRDDIAELNRGIEGQSGEVARVVRSLYQGSSIRSVQVLLDSGEALELQRRAGYLASAQQFQQGLLESFAADHRVLHAEVAELEAAEKRAAALDAELAEQAQAIEARLEDQRSEVAHLTATIERLERERAEREAAEREAAERAAREAAARAAAEEAARQAAERAAAQQQAPPVREVAGRADRTARGGQPDAEPSPQAEPAPRPQPAPAPADPDPDPEPEPEPEPPPARDPPQPSSVAHVALEAARSQLGKPYRWGASGPDAYDCSGLTSWAWAQAGVSIPRSSGAQYAALPKVDRANLRPGDLVFFGSPIHHVGIYAGGGQMIEAPYTGQTVRYRSVDRRDYTGAARPG